MHNFYFFLIIMNIHPVVVHFPVALLTLYSLLEIATLFWRERTKKLQQTKLFLLFVWTIGTFFALQSGEIAQDYLGIKSELMHTHEEFAEKTYSTYIWICIYYLLIIAQTNWFQRYLPEKRQAILTKILTRPYRRFFVIVAATAWLILLTITWALWWAISQWPDADPIVRFVYDLLITP